MVGIEVESLALEQAFAPEDGENELKTSQWSSSERRRRMMERLKRSGILPVTASPWKARGDRKSAAHQAMHTAEPVPSKNPIIVPHSNGFSTGC